MIVIDNLRCVMITMYVVEQVVSKSTNKGWTQSTFHDVIADCLTIWVVWQFNYIIATL